MFVLFACVPWCVSIDLSALDAGNPFADILRPLVRAFHVFRKYAALVSQIRSLFFQSRDHLQTPLEHYPADLQVAVPSCFNL